MTKAEERGYRPISDYALIGDAHTAALVARDGSVDWCCWPHFDSPAVFCRILDAQRGGWFRVGPAAERYGVARSYVETTNVLATEFETDNGSLRLTDLMPVYRQTRTHEGEDIAARYRILRLIEGLSGAAEVEIEFRPTFDYARAATIVAANERGAIATAGQEALALSCPIALQADEAGGVAGKLKIAAGERVWLALTYHADTAANRVAQDMPDADKELEETLDYWREWSQSCAYDGPYSGLVKRSALVLKLLTFEPTGAIVAAPTTSLPEVIGGVRNWDYRFSWLRDSGLILYALQLLGYHEEATDFFDWLDRVCVPHQKDLHIMYSIHGEAELTERELAHLEGYRGSRPVRIGNEAYGQSQLDIYGNVMDAAYLYHERMRQPVRAEWWDEIQFLADEAARRWHEPDHGPWEVRAGERHYLYSKLYCWVALDRAIRLARYSHPEADTSHWQRACAEIRRTILAEGYNERVGAFTQSFSSEDLDASSLVIPLVGFLPATDPRVLSTAARIREQLTAQGLVYRYLADDGLPGKEATFTLCSFWMVDNLALAGQVEEARALFEKIISYANDVGLLSEEIEPESGELLGNHPQGFTHLGLICSALNIAKAEALGAEAQAETCVERAGQMELAGSRPGWLSRRGKE